MIRKKYGNRGQQRHRKKKKLRTSGSGGCGCGTWTPWLRLKRRRSPARGAGKASGRSWNGQVVGYAGAWIIIDESHITNIAVTEEERGRGIGRKLTEALMQYISNLGAAYATLEVRVSNERAQNLYRSLGFVSVGKRKRYYEDNGEDAYLMVCEHMPEVEEDFEEHEPEESVGSGQ